MNNDIRLNNLEKWYSREDIKYNIIKFTKNRETAFLIPNYESEEMSKRSVRMLKIHSIQHLDYNIFAMSMFKRKTPYNFYYSLSEYRNGIPNQNLSENMKFRDNAEFYKNSINEIRNYDYLIDIDIKNFKYVDLGKEVVKQIESFLKKYNIKYSVYFSGSGFHVVIKLNYIILGDYFTDVFTIFKKSSLFLNKKYGDMIDKNYGYHALSLIKIPFSVSNYKKSQYVALPVCDIDNFDYRHAELSKMLNNGINYRNYEIKYVNIDENTHNFFKFISEVLK